MSDASSTPTNGKTILWRVQQLERRSDTWDKTTRQSDVTASEVSDARQDISDLKTDMGRVRTALYTLAGSSIIASLVFAITAYATH